MSTANIKTLFNPNNIAIVGASNNPQKAGYVIVKNLLNKKYPGKIFPVNNKEKEILGLRCYQKVSQITDRVELIVLITPSRLIFKIMDDLEKRMKDKNDVRAIVCAAAGYAETKSEQGIGRQQVLIDTAKKYGIRVMGPNCIGVIDNINRVDTTFVETLLPKESKGKKGGISFVSQSGAVAASILMMGASQPEPISFNKFVSIGNMADIDFIDILEYFEQDEHTKVIGLYMEGYPRAKELIKLMARIAKKKPIVVFKVGRSEKGASAANSHTGSLAGSDLVYDCAFRQFGIIRVDSIQELMDTMQAFDKLPLPENENLFVLSQAGGPGIFCTDTVNEYSFIKMPVVKDETKNNLKELLPPMASVCKPEGYADITASANVEHHTRSLELLLQDPEVSSVIFITVIPTFLPQKKLADALIKMYKDKGYLQKKPVFTVIMAGNYVQEARQIMERAGIHTFTTPDRAARAAANMIKYIQFINRGDK